MVDFAPLGDRVVVKPLERKRRRVQAYTCLTRPRRGLRPEKWWLPDLGRSTDDGRGEFPWNSR